MARGRADNKYCLVHAAVLPIRDRIYRTDAALRMSGYADALSVKLAEDGGGAVPI